MKMALTDLQLEMQKKRRRERKRRSRGKQKQTGLERYEVLCVEQDKPLMRYFADWLLGYSLTLEQLREILGGK
jgi:hypothetical protein